VSGFPNEIILRFTLSTIVSIGADRFAKEVAEHLRRLERYARTRSGKPDTQLKLLLI
jgi:hypothetical protein